METIGQFLHEIETEIDLVYSYEEGMSFSDFADAVIESINETEIIYHSIAMDYLMEHDSSLTKSLSLASEMGYLFEGVNNANSELLATLLYQDNLRNEWYELSEEIEEYFEEYEEYIETLNEDEEWNNESNWNKSIYVWRA